MSGKRQLSGQQHGQRSSFKRKRPQQRGRVPRDEFEVVPREKIAVGKHDDKKSSDRSGKDKQSLLQQNSAKERLQVKEWKRAYGNEEKFSDAEEDAQDAQNGDGSADESEMTAHDKSAAFADVMGKILGTASTSNKESQATAPPPPTSATIAPAPILSKSKSIEKRLDEERLLRKAQRAALHEKKAERDRDHVLANDPLTMSMEIRLRKIATKGVVKLFNAIRQQQQQQVDGINSEARKMQADKNKQMFVDFLKGPSTDASAVDATVTAAPAAQEQKTTEATVLKSTIPIVAAEAPSKPSTWDVLSDQYLMGATFKDWDKQ